MSGGIFEDCLRSFFDELLIFRVTYENRNESFFYQFWAQLKDSRNSSGTEFRSSYFTNVWNLFSKTFLRSGKKYHPGFNLGTSKSSK